jgi:RNA polymerase sigma-70 factor, ECF subfamily
MDANPTEITTLLHAHAAGDPLALERLLPRVYDELRRIARARLRRERASIRSPHRAGARGLSQADAARPGLLAGPRPLLRHRLAGDAQRARRPCRAARRGQAGRGRDPLTLDDAARACESPLDDLIALNDALARLERLDARQARVVECRFFGGLSLDETAEALCISAGNREPRLDLRARLAAP